MATTNGPGPAPATPERAPIRQFFQHRSVRVFCLALMAAVLISLLGKSCQLGQAGPQSPEDNQAVADLRQSSRARMMSIFDAFERSLSLDAASVESVSERCDEGTDDWKRTDPFLERCELSITRYYGYDGEFGRATHTLHARLRGAVVLVEEAEQTGSDSVRTRTEVIENVASADEPSFRQIGRIWGTSREYYRVEEMVDDQVPLSELSAGSDHVVAVNLSEIYYVLRR